MGPLVIAQNASIPIALNLRNRLNGAPLINPGAGARASLVINFPDGTTKLCTNIQRQTVTLLGAITSGNITVTLGTVNGTVPVTLTYPVNSAASASQIAAGIALFVNANLPTNWAVVEDGVDIVFASPGASDTVTFATSGVINLAIAPNPTYPTVVWTNGQLVFTPPQACFALAGSGTWNVFIDQSGNHIPSATGAFRVVAPGDFAYASNTI